MIIMLGLGKHFYRLWFSQIFSQTAVNILHFMLLLELYERTKSNFVVGLLVFILSVCPVIFSGIAGVVADRFNRRHILMAVNFSRAAIVLLMLVTEHWVWMTLILTFVFTAIAQFFPPTESASIPELVPHEKLITANSLFSFTLYGAFLLGYLIAGPLIAWVGVSWVFVILIGMYLVASFQNWQLPDLTSHIGHQHGLAPKSFSFSESMARLKEGFGFIWRDSTLLPLLIMVSLVFGLERGAASLIPDVANRVMQYSNTDISLFLILPLGLGTVMGALAMNRLKYRLSKPLLIIVASFLETLVLASFFGIGTLPEYKSFLMFLFAFLIGLGDVFIIVGVQTLIQERMGTEIRGRAFGVVLTTVNVIGLPIILLLSYLSGKVDLVKLLSNAGGIGFAAVLLFGFLGFSRHYQTKTSSIPPVSRLD